MIKYFFQNLKSFFTTEPAVFVLTVLSIYCASIMLFFSFGFYHHLEQKKLDGEYGEKVYWVNFYDRYQWTYWYFWFVKEGADKYYVLSLSADQFSKEEAIEIAKTVVING